MDSIVPSFRGEDNPSETYEGEGSGGLGFTMTYRHWFVVSLLILMNVLIFGCIFLAALGKIRLGG